MKKTWLKISGWVLIVIGIIGALALLFSLFTFSRPGYQDAPMYTPFVLFGIVFTVANLFLGVNLLKLKNWVVFSTLVFSALASLSFLWVIMMGQVSRNDYLRVFTIFFPEKNAFLLVVYIAVSVTMLFNLSSKSDV